MLNKVAEDHTFPSFQREYALSMFSEKTGSANRFLQTEYAMGDNAAERQKVPFPNLDPVPSFKVSKLRYPRGK